MAGAVSDSCLELTNDVQWLTTVVTAPDCFRYLPACLPSPDHPTTVSLNISSVSLTCDLSTVFRGLIRRNAVYLTAIFTSAFAFEIAYDSASNRIWDAMNRGRQWKDIKHQYMVKDEEDDE
ncbi:ubiquinol-cytochrome C reductase [Aspergillus flavus]|uniref:Complex III subunit 9 n=4 Tax=Aspergillus subgen. Circumdati TaxID=2720871 RepID=B8NNI7_ASPFN|nr:unnamed protein product [Aspergillus oryzae RIB40]XP_041142291.1 uncharacterized protein G4B84_002577 [Aspergillus flavus NRRL3357]KAB8249846.1 ubiquinol-cytochrome C reductase [Aspergillus flavus]KOC13021.1 hypothetical protein AFLA70_90g002410 [Aspergillus flavus AF70]OOO04720.1 Ubiquinol-cytochrome C reductase, UQCRX/QCR9-like [Aspergillus oryzae]QMW27288.1 hypothetical protein G4B84_002577 [Aspergillus flavus NRRL3357]QMW39359.1 hypothetical protein G4B11_002639 [Aspergillus flavus]